MRKCMQSVKEKHSNACFNVLAPSDREWSRQRDESLIDILTEFCPCLVFYPLYKEREKNVKESAKHQKLSFKQQEHEG